MKKDSFLKDALVLTLITLVAGFLLGGVYGLTKDQIALINWQSTQDSYRAVMPEAAEFDEEIYLENLDKANQDGTVSANNAGAVLTSIVLAKDSQGNDQGYIVKGSCAGYGGQVVVVVGIDTNLTVTGISFPETLPETAGLGQKALQPEFYSQFEGKGTGLLVDKDGGTGDNRIDAISGATITSRAVTNTVNAATEFVKDYIR